LAPNVDGGVNWAWVVAPVATNINVAVSIDLMTSLLMTRLGSIDVSAIKHIWLVGNSRRRVQQMVARQPSLPGAKRQGDPVSRSKDTGSTC
jgi:hypothetical protein